MKWNLCLEHPCPDLLVIICIEFQYNLDFISSHVLDPETFAQVMDRSRDRVDSVVFFVRDKLRLEVEIIILSLDLFIFHILLCRHNVRVMMKIGIYSTSCTLSYCIKQFILQPFDGF